MTESLLHAVLHGAETAPNRTAVHAAEAACTHAQLRQQVSALGEALRAVGLAGRRVGVLLPNVPAFPVAALGLLAAPARLLLLNPLCAPREIGEFLAGADVADVVTTAALEPWVPPSARVLRIDALPDALEWRHANRTGTTRITPRHGGKALPHANGVAAEAEAVVVYTAANDGWPRGARLSHRNLVANLRSTVEALSLTADDVVIAALPLIHTFGFTVCMNAPLSVGASIIPVERFHPLRVLDLLESSGATVFAGVPAMYKALLAAVERHGVPEHKLRVAICGGAPHATQLSLQWERTFGLPLREGYGLTEGAPVCLFNRVDRPNRPGTLGYPFPHVDVSIRGPDGEPLAQGEVGEICVSGPNVFPGYVGEPDRAAADFFGDWFRTGDLGSEEPDGAVRFRGFLKPMFTRNGFNVYPREVQRALQVDPRIEHVDVCALPDEARENEVVLRVRAAPGAALTEADVRELCKHRLAAYKQPSRIEIDPLPGAEPATGSPLFTE